MPPKKLFILVSTTVTVAFLAIFLSLSPSLIGADTVKSGGKDLSSELGLSKGTVVLTKEKTQDGQVFTITRQNWLIKRTLDLIGFEEEANPCADHQIDFPQNSSSVCLVGEVGAHSMNLQIIRLAGLGLRAASFVTKDGLVNQNIASDLPFFSFTDKNGDNLIDLIVYNRDYDSDPLQYAFKSYYLCDREGNYHFDSEERIAYNISNN